jgi:hypothetical protein
MVLDRKLHAFNCGACGRQFVIEKEMLYFDFDRRQFIGVFPTTERARERECGERLVKAFETTVRDQAPAFVQDASRDFLVRITFGYEELREKLVIDEAGLSDLVVESVKCDRMASDGSLLDNRVLTLRLDHVTESGDLSFYPEWEDPALGLSGFGSIVVERSTYDAVAAHAATLAADPRGLASGPHCSLLRLIDWSRL